MVEEVLVAVVVDMEVVARLTVAAEVVVEATAAAAVMAHHEEVATVVATGREDLDTAPTRIVEREMSKGCDSVHLSHCLVLKGQGKHKIEVDMKMGRRSTFNSGFGCINMRISALRSCHLAWLLGKWAMGQGTRIE